MGSRLFMRGGWESEDLKVCGLNILYGARSSARRERERELKKVWDSSPRAGERERERDS